MTEAMWVISLSHMKAMSSQGKGVKISTIFPVLMVKDQEAKPQTDIQGLPIATKTSEEMNSVVILILKVRNKDPKIHKRNDRDIESIDGSDKEGHACPIFQRRIQRAI